MAIGRWFRDRPRGLESAYRLTLALLDRVAPQIRRAEAGRVNRITARLEHPPKALLFDCKMCGQCTLHATGMTCPMSCPKNIRNGPCGGVRTNGHCEVKPEMTCIWVEAYARNMKMTVYPADFHNLQPPLNRQFEGTSAWINLVEDGRTALPDQTLALFTQALENSHDRP